MDEEMKTSEALLGETANNVLSREMIRQACSVFRGPAVNRSKKTNGFRFLSARFQWLP
jgi:hypothetical protein